MTTVPAVEFRRHLAEHLDRARAGEAFEIVRGGRPTARLLPPTLEEECDDE